MKNTIKVMKVVKQTDNFVSAAYVAHSYKGILRNKILVKFQEQAMVCYSLFIRLLCTDVGWWFGNIQ